MSNHVVIHFTKYIPLFRGLKQNVGELNEKNYHLTKMGISRYQMELWVYRLKYCLRRGRDD